MTFHPRRRDHYGLLGLAADASFVEIRQAFRARAKEFHPDLNTSRYARDAFLAINEAHYVLRDPMRRDAYDAARADARDAAIRWAVPDNIAAHWPSRVNAWFAGVALAGALGAAALFVLADTPPLDPSRAAIVRLVAAEPPPADPRAPDAPLAATAEIAPENTADRTPEPPAAPLPAALDTAPEPLDIGTWQATATPGQVPPVSALDVLAETSPSASVPAAALAVKTPAPLAKRTAAALVSKVRRAAAAPVNTSRYQAAAQAARSRYLAKARWAAAHAKARATRKAHRTVRKATKRRYATG